MDSELQLELQSKGEPKMKKTRKLRITKKSPIVINTQAKPVSPSPPKIKEQKERLNEKIVDMLTTLSTIMSKRGDFIKSRIYSRASETIMAMDIDITKVEQLKGRPGIGPTIMEKVEELIKTGTLELIERERNRPENLLSDVYGVGPKKAK